MTRLAMDCAWALGWAALGAWMRGCPAAAVPWVFSGLMAASAVGEARSWWRMRRWRRQDELDRAAVAMGLRAPRDPLL